MSNDFKEQLVAQKLEEVKEELTKLEEHDIRLNPRVLIRITSAVTALVMLAWYAFLVVLAVPYGLTATIIMVSYVVWRGIQLIVNNSRLEDQVDGVFGK